MKKLTIVLFVLVAFLVAACAPKTTETTLPGTPGQITEVKTAGEAAMEQKCSFDEEATSAKAIQGKDLAAYPPVVKDLDVGDCATFGIVVGNYHNNLPIEVHVELRFMRAYDANNNNPGVDEAYMMNWVTTNFPQSFALGPNKIAVFPVNVIVGDKMSPDKETKPASYEFELVTYTYKGSFKNEYQPNLRLTVKTK